MHFQTFLLIKCIFHNICNKMMFKNFILILSIHRFFAALVKFIYKFKRSFLYFLKITNFLHMKFIFIPHGKPLFIFTDCKSWIFDQGNRFLYRDFIFFNSFFLKKSHRFRVFTVLSTFSLIYFVKFSSIERSITALFFQIL